MCLPVKLAGFGLRSAVAGADAANVASRGLTLEYCADVDSRFVSDGSAFADVQCQLGEAIGRLDTRLPQTKPIHLPLKSS